MKNSADHYSSFGKFHIDWLYYLDKFNVEWLYSFDKWKIGGLSSFDKFDGVASFYKIDIYPLGVVGYFYYGVFKSSTTYTKIIKEVYILISDINIF